METILSFLGSSVLTNILLLLGFLRIRIFPSQLPSPLTSKR